MMTLNAQTYYYVTNLQGDVIAMLDSSGNTVASYTYDAWGRVLTATGSLAIINPLRYRGYVYDHETGLYYLQSRYYNPELGRFINADAYTSTGGLLGNNMFAYCGNNPILYEDETGMRAVLNLRVSGGRNYFLHDGNELSEDLLNYLQQNLGDLTSYENFFMNVKYIDKCEKETDNTGKEVLKGINMAATVASLFVGVPASISFTLGVISLMADIDESINSDPLPDGWYHLCTVELSWKETEIWNGGTTYTYHSYKFLFLWDTISQKEDSWYHYKSYDYTSSEVIYP